jgi:hypothetical protein
MTNTDILDELFDSMFTEIVSIKDETSLRQFKKSIFRVLCNEIEIPKESYQLISDKRFHLKFDIIDGFLWQFEKLNKTVCNILKSYILKLSKKIKISYIDENTMNKIIIHTLIVNFFMENPNFLSRISENPSIDLLQGFFSNNPIDMGFKAN